MPTKKSDKWVHQLAQLVNRLPKQPEDPSLIVENQPPSYPLTFLYMPIRTYNIFKKEKKNGTLRKIDICTTLMNLRPRL